MMIQLPKIKRIVDKSAIKKIHSIGYCECCGSYFNLACHHIKSRGSGGNDTVDNMTLLCFKCHSDTHSGIIPRNTLRAIVGKRKWDYLTILLR